MKTLISTNSLQEDLDALGVKGLDEDAMVAVALGQPLSEKCKGKKGGEGVCPECECDPCECETEGEEGDEEYEESKHDPLDGPFVTNELFDRIMALPFDNLDEEDVQRVIDGLMEKKIPRNVPGIEERAQQVAQHLTEIAAKRTRRARARKMSKKASYQCPEGYRKDPKDPNGKRCIRAAVAAGGAGKLSKAKRLKRKWTKSGAGKKSLRISGRWAERRGTPGESFAVELESLLSEHSEQVQSVRADILDRIDSIVEMLVQEFDDEAVMAVFNEAIEPIAASYEAGRMDEDVMDADAFLTELRPVMALISKSLDRLERSDRGNA